MRYTFNMSFVPHRKNINHTNPVWQGILIGVLILVIVWIISIIIGLFGKAQIAWQTAHQTQREAAVLKNRAKVLEQNIHTLNTPRGYSAAVRTEFGVARPGEDVIIVIPSRIATSTQTKKIWWRRVFNILHL